MCGIAGELRFDQRVSDLAVTKNMCNAQIHRGPDEEGYYASGPVSLGIRRLAIIDLTTGLYPLRNEGGTIRLVFNGEIYGFNTLRTELERHNHKFYSNTDAETVVHAYEEWGTECLDRLNGMFAFALWDEPKQLLWIARDHFGIKPLYYHKGKDFLAFASEIKPLLVHPDVTVAPNDRAIGEYLSFGLVDIGEETFFEGISRLAPGHYLLIHREGVVEQKRYWKPRVSRELGGRVPHEEIERTRQLFLDSIERQLVSDVPVGTCLSGGIDSSSVVCSIKKVHPRGAVSTGKNIKTFSTVFPGNSIDESRYAAIVCRTTGAERNCVTPTAEELWRDLPSLVKCQEEPFRSTSIYAQWRVMKLAKERGVKVVLDGQGGDELLCGYQPYYVYYLMTLKKHGKYLKLIAEATKSRAMVMPVFKAYLSGLAGRSIKRLGHRILKDHTTSWNGLVLRYPQHEAKPRLVRAPVSDLAAILEMDTGITSLPSLLRYEDKNSMWHSIEARVPFLDREFAEYVASLPLDRKLRNGWTKYVFRMAMSGILPEEIRLRRSKIGFETPEKMWIETEIRGRLKKFFSDPALRATEWYNPEAVRGILDRPSLTSNEISLLWRVLNLELWYREFFTSTGQSGGQ